MKFCFVLMMCLAGSFYSMGAHATDPGFTVDPVGQATTKSCQSYVLAVGLAFKRDNAFPISNWRQLRDAEQSIRHEIESAYRVRLPDSLTMDPTHEDIRIGFANYTAGTYSLKMQSVDIVEFSDKVASKTNVTSASSVPLNFLLGTATKDVVMSSAIKIGKDSYEQGHIFTIFGMDGPPNSDRKFLILNSAIKSKDITRNACMADFPDDAGPYTASLSWRSIGDISLKSFGGKYLIWTIEKN